MFVYCLLFPEQLPADGVSNFAKKSNVLHNDSLRATSLDGKFAQSSARSPARENEKSICRLTASLSGAAVRHKVEHGLDIFGVHLNEHFNAIDERTCKNDSVHPVLRWRMGRPFWKGSGQNDSKRMQTSYGPLQAGSQPKGSVQTIGSKPKPIAHSAPAENQQVVVPVHWGSGNHLQSRMQGDASSIKI
jgi:hypothetical protein